MPVDPRLEALDSIETDSADTPEPTEVETQAPVEDTPEATEAPTIDWAKRYGDLRSEFDRRAQREAEREEQLRQYQEQLEQLQSQSYSPAPVDEDEDGYYEDPLQDPRLAAQLARLDRLEAQLAEQQQQDTLAKQQAEEYAYVDAQLDQIEKSLGRELSEYASTRIGRDALEHRDPVTGLPDVEGAFDAYRRELEAEKKHWASTKRSASAPASGPGAVEVPDLDDRDQLEAYLDRAFEQGLGG